MVSKIIPPTITAATIIPNIGYSFASPIRIAITEVSPTDPGILPKKASNQEKLSFSPGIPFSAATPKAVAPL